MTHGQLVKQVMLDWCAQKRGRLFPYRQGLVEQGGRVMKVGWKGVSDLIGWEDFKITVSRSIACFCAVEVKTLAYPKLSTEQKAFLTAVDNAGGQAYIARENHEGGYDLENWTEF
jgi:hypothetical protein